MGLWPTNPLWLLLITVSGASLLGALGIVAGILALAMVYWTIPPF